MANQEEYSRGDFLYRAWSGDVVSSLAAVPPDYEDYALLGWTSDRARPYVVRAGGETPGRAPLTSLGSTFAEITGGMIAKIRAFYGKNGRYPRSWGEYRFNDIGLDPAEWEGRWHDHIGYGPSGARVSARPEAGLAMEVTGRDGKKRVLTNKLNWSLWYDVAGGQWYYHSIKPGNEIDIDTLVVRPE